jgi:hypothetical protein
MIAGVITKKSVGRALKARIKAMEIIQYLEEAAHPQVFVFSGLTHDVLSLMVHFLLHFVF